MQRLVRKLPYAVTTASFVAVAATVASQVSVDEDKTKTTSNFLSSSPLRSYYQTLGSNAWTFLLTSNALCEGSNSKSTQMYYRTLGNTGLEVSVLSYGFWATFGAKKDLSDHSAVDQAKAILRVARDAGINLFDNAETYGNPQGLAETIMGQAIKELQEEDPVKWRRSDIIITTKLYWGGSGHNEKGLSKKHVMEGMEASLKRLQVDYVDLVFCHRPCAGTPTETVVRNMTDLIRSGKATAWGTSEWSAQQITEAVWIAKTQSLEPPMFEQPQYNIFHRERFESEYFPIFQEPYNFGTTIWSPLASGLLTGKYNTSIPEGSRATTNGYSFILDKLEKWRQDGSIDKVITLTDYAKKKYNCSVTQLSLAWCLKNENVTTVLLGATKPSQLEENIEALNVAAQITDADMKEINDILGNKPIAYAGYKGRGYREVPRLPK